MKKNKLITILTWIWVIAAIIAIIVYFDRYYQSAIDYVEKVNVLNLIIATALIFITRILNVDLIRESVQEVGWVPTFKGMIALVSFSQLGKYIPGGVWQYAARYGVYKENNLSLKSMGKAFLLENIWVVFGGAMSGLILLSISAPSDFLARFHFILSRFAQLIVALSLFIVWVFGLVVIQKLFHKSSLRVGFSRVLRLLISQSLMFFLMGLSFSLLFPNLAIRDFLFTIGGYIISYVVGYLAIFAPGGLGVREVVSVAFFTGMIPIGELTALTLVHRLLYTVVEFVMGLYGFIYTKKKGISGVKNHE